MLEAHAEGNTEIANRFLPKPAKTLFMEPVPEGSESWEEYPGLSAERAIEISLRVNEIAIRGEPAKTNLDPSEEGNAIPALYPSTGE